MLCCDKLRQNTVLWTLRDWRFKSEGLFFISLLVYVANFKGCGKPLQGKHHKQKHIMWCSSFPFPLLRKNDNCMDVATVIPFTLLIFLLRLIKSGLRIQIWKNMAAKSILYLLLLWWSLQVPIHLMRFSPASQIGL